MAQVVVRPGKFAPLNAQRGTLPGAVTMERATSYAGITNYNNFHEFGADKSDPARHAGSLKTRPWSVLVEGEVKKPGDYDIEALLKLAPMKERIYRLRCVEGWSMVVPWVGYSLSELIKQIEPTGNAKFVQFTTLADRNQMPGIRSSVFDRPYVEGLRMDEAMHALTLQRSTCTVRPCRRKAAPRCAWWCRESTASNRASPSCAYASLRSNRAPAGMKRRGLNTAPIPTSTPQSTIRAGARPASGASAKTAYSPRSERRLCSTATGRKSRSSTLAWTCTASFERARFTLGPVAAGAAGQARAPRGLVPAVGQPGLWHRG